MLGGSCVQTATTRVALIFTGEHMHRSVLRLLAAFLVALVVLPLSAVSASAATYTISGRITGLTETGATVALEMVDIEASDFTAGTVVGHTFSNRDGYYTLTLPRGGDFELKTWCQYAASDNNCKDFAGEYYENAAATPFGSKPVTVVDGQPTVVDFQLDRLATVTGRVVDSAGVAVPNVDVSSWAAEYPDYEHATTDANGYYTLTRVDAFADHVEMHDPAGQWADAWVDAPIAPGPDVTTINVTAQLLQDFAAAPTPTISGTARVGSPLTVSIGTWSPDPSYLDIRWYRVSSTGSVEAIEEGYEQTYTPTSADLGFRLQVEVTGFEEGYRTTTRTSAPTAAVDGLTAPTPTITGTAAVGSVLTANPGTWGPAPVTLAYQWYRSGTAITGATAQTYTLTGTDLGTTITVEVTGSKTGYATTSKTSAATAAVLNSFTTAPTPTITGTTAVGYTLTASPGTWAPAPDSLGYQWYRAGVAISGATTSAYKLTSLDQGKAITVRVTAAKAGYLSTAKTSAATGAIRGVYSTAPTPTVSGTKAVGYTLTANAGTWSPTPTSFTYQWYRGTTAISGATLRTYKLTSYDKGKVVKVKVTPVLTGYYSPGKYSAGYTIS